MDGLDILFTRYCINNLNDTKETMYIYDVDTIEELPDIKNIYLESEIKDKKTFDLMKNRSCIRIFDVYDRKEILSYWRTLDGLYIITKEPTDPEEKKERGILYCAESLNGLGKLINAYYLYSKKQ